MLTFLVCAFLVLVLISNWYLVRRIRDLENRVKDYQTEAMKLYHTRQGALALAKNATRKTPGVDAEAKTTRRDTNDIPRRGGKMSTGVHREKSNGFSSDS